MTSILDVAHEIMAIHMWYVRTLEPARRLRLSQIYSSYYYMVSNYFRPQTLESGVWYVVPLSFYTHAEVPLGLSEQVYSSA